MVRLLFLHRQLKKDLRYKPSRRRSSKREDKPLRIFEDGSNILSEDNPDNAIDLRVANLMLTLRK
jgi:hypothetical protein